jgi:ADP-ribosylglycohydrolase
MDADALKGMLWGVAIGDALGAPHEFRTGTRLRDYTGVLQFPVVRQNQWQGRRVGVVGQVSDDTEMALALARSLVDARRYDRAHAVKAYMAWANSKCPFMGNNTRALFHGVKTLRGYEGRYRKVYGAAHQDGWTQSNGCLMRCAPIAVLGAAADAAIQVDCALTNPHPVCVDACRVYIRAALALGQGELPEDVLEGAAAWAETDVIRNVLAEAAQPGSERDVTGGSKGWVVHALWCAFRSLAVLAEHGTFEDAIDWVVRLDGDTDTNACIAGALLGAALGYEGMVSETRTGANIGLARLADPSQGALPRPPQYRASEIDRLALGLSNIFGV